jgi:D-3-phosphoglycerate dehydrogenase
VRLAQRDPPSRRIFVFQPNEGGILSEEALLHALRQGRVAGAALDVFEHEPAIDSRLLCEECVILTPHIAGSTAESRAKIGVELAREVLRVLQGEPPAHPVNLPAMSPLEWQTLAPYLTLAERLAMTGSVLMSGQLRGVAAECSGPALERALPLVTGAALRGLLAQCGDETVNLVNARSIAKLRGLALSETYVSGSGDENTVTLRLETTEGITELLGGLTRGLPHALRVNGYWLDFPLQGMLLFSEHREGPGVLGDVGAVIGTSGVSISFVQLGRAGRGGRGLMVLGLDDTLGTEPLARLRALPSVVWLREVMLPSSNAM